jgi:hypothetical protein
MKHNKKRNTAFLYECLIKEITKAVVRKENARKASAIAIVKEWFSKGQILYQDLQTYKQLLETKNLKQDFARRYVTEVKKDWQNLDRKKIFNEQTKLIKQINESLGAEVFGNFVQNYRNLATIGQFFNSSSVTAKNRLVLEDKVKSLVMIKENKKKEENLLHLDKLTYKTFVSKFNEAYQHSLRNEQRLLLTNYITSFSDNGLGLKGFMNEEIGRLKQEIDSVSETKYSNELTKVKEKLESYSKTPLTEDIVKEVFYIQDLIAEIKK